MRAIGTIYMRRLQCLEPIPGCFSQIKLSQIATETHNSQKFSPSKETHYMVFGGWDGYGIDLNTTVQVDL